MSINKIILSKAEKVAEEQCRSLSSYVEHLCKEDIKKYLSSDKLEKGKVTKKINLSKSKQFLKEQKKHLLIRETIDKLVLPTLIKEIRVKTTEEKFLLEKIEKKTVNEITPHKTLLLISEKVIEEQIGDLCIYLEAFSKHNIREISNLNKDTLAKSKDFIENEILNLHIHLETLCKNSISNIIERLGMKSLEMKQSETKLLK